MKWPDLVALVSREPVFRSSLLLSGTVSTAQIRLQLTRWVQSGRLIQLRRGLYVLAPPWRQVEPHPFLIANALQPGSYVSQQSALAFHGLIPEHVPIVTSLGPGRPETIHNPLGAFQFKHIARRLVDGYSQIDVAPAQQAFVAGPEKALLDMLYLTPGGDSEEYLQGLRLQNLDTVRTQALLTLAERSGKPRLIRGARRVVRMVASDVGEPL